MAYKSGDRASPETEFKPGMPPSHKLPVGSVTRRTHKFDQERAWIKIAEPNKWVLNANLVWMRHGGTIPRGFVVHHLDGNPINDDIGNLALVSRAHHIGIHRDALSEARTGKPLALKDVTCPACGQTYRAKAQRKDASCPICRKA